MQREFNWPKMANNVYTRVTDWRHCACNNENLKCARYLQLFRANESAIYRNCYTGPIASNRQINQYIIVMID